ncbi:heme biosynthesis protein HemY [Vibrio sp. SM6]|uniref:Heme biosynthesis protein HemY n=1 Tax=Vibrio agarilyticus TaxID=2726741 RepID=A0A7X8YHM6_9VIBR|nr:heme biosynthesis HemY N-terminal domain-containing protein [Vibrio agarilyticus]NLS13661.1 heme biosynthesis protein HemY [Vibrio agarilyticus]
MIRLVLLFALLGLGLYAGAHFSGQQGYVLISMANQTIEMSVTTLVILVGILIALLFVIEQIIKKLVRTGSHTWHRFSLRKIRRARGMVDAGLLDLQSGHWKLAEKRLSKYAPYHDTPLLGYLMAAKAANKQGETARRDEYLAKAQALPDSTESVELMRAKLQLQAKQYTDALSTLNTLKTHDAHNSEILRLLSQTYQALELWQPLLELLPSLLKHKLIDDTRYRALSESAECGRLAEIGAQQGSSGLTKHWARLPRKTKQNPELIAEFARQLIIRGADSDAFTALKEGLKKFAHPALFSLLPQLNLADDHPIVVLLENTVAKSPADASAHSALAQLYFRQQHWLDAQRQFEQALTMRSNVVDYAYLASALERQHFYQASQDVMRKVTSLLDAPIAPALPAPKSVEDAAELDANTALESEATNVIKEESDALATQPKMS